VAVDWASVAPFMSWLYDLAVAVGLFVVGLAPIAVLLRPRVRRRRHRSRSYHPKEDVAESRLTTRPHAPVRENADGKWQLQSSVTREPERPKAPQ